MEKETKGEIIPGAVGALRHQNEFRAAAEVSG